jgi:hypothetical protein
MQRRIAVSLWHTVGLLILLTSNLLAVGPLDIWQWRNCLPQGNKLVAVNYCGGLLIAVGNQGAIVTSPGLTTAGWTNTGWASPNAWTNSGWFVGNSRTNLSLNCVAYGTNNWVIGAAGGNVLTSQDGTNWTTRSTGVSTKDLAGIAYSTNFGFVAVTAGGNILASPDGTNWTARTSGTTKDLASITYRPGIGFMAVGAVAGTGLNSLILTSPDGNNPWVLQNSATTIGLNAITFGTNSSGDGFFVVAGSSGLIMTSPDGTNWTSQSSGITASLKSVAYGPGVGFVAVGSSSSVSWITASPDGINWTGGICSLSGNGNEGLGGVTYAPPGMFVTVGYYGMAGSSPDGNPANWVAQNLTIHGNDYYNAGAWDGTNIVMVGTGGAVVSSPDGVTWTNRGSGVTVTTSLRSIGCGMGKFVAVGDGGVVITSEDSGTNWTAQPAVGLNLKGIACDGTNFVAVGGTGIVATSPDGTNWTFQSSGIPGNLTSVAYGPGHGFVAVSDSGPIYTSPDGTNWAAQTSGVTISLNGITYGGNLFVVAGSRNVMLSSPDGTNWTIRGSGQGSSSSPTLNSIAYGSGQFVVAGGSAAVYSSPNGINWTTNADVNGVSQRCIVYGANSFVIGGSGGILLQASATQPQVVYGNSSGALTLTWSGGGTLQAAPVVTGPYTNVPGASSPYAITPLTAPSMFYRVRLP